MSEESINGCIQHKDIRHYRTYHDYMLLYKNEHKAKIIRILETWTDTKRAAWYKEACTNKEQGQLAPEPDFWITMSFRQFRNALYETIGVDTIKQTLDELVGKDKHVERRLNPEVPYGPPQYRLNIPVLQKALNKLPVQGVVPDIPAFEEDTPQGKTYPPGKGTPPPGVSFTPTQGGNVPPPRGETYPQGRGENTPPSNNSNKNHGKNHPKGDTSNGDTASADRPPAPSLSSALSALLDSWHNGDAEEQQAAYNALVEAGIVPPREQHAPDSDGETPAEQPPSDTPSQLSPTVDNQPSSVDTPSQLPDQQLHAPQTRTGQATATTTPSGQSVEIPATTTASESPLNAKQEGCHSDGGTEKQEDGASYSQHSHMPTPNTEITQEKPARSRSASRGKKPKPPEDDEPTEPVEPPKMPDASMPWGTRKCMLLFDYWRGAPFISKGKIIQASQCAKGLATYYTEEQVIQAYKVMKDDPYYAERGDPDICDVANNIAKYLKRINRKTSASTKTMVEAGVSMEEAKARAEARNREQLEKLRARQARLQAQKGA